MRYLLAPAAILAAVATLLTAITPVHACSCAIPPTDELVEGADVVARATITARVPAADPVPLGTFDADFDALATVDRYYKGTGPADIVIDDTGLQTCRFLGLDNLGESHLLFLWLEDGILKTHLCSGNLRLTGEYSAGDYGAKILADVEAITGPGKPPDAPEATPRPTEHVPRDDECKPLGESQSGDRWFGSDEGTDAAVAFEQFGYCVPAYLDSSHDDLPREVFWALAIVLPFVFLAAAMLSPWRRR
jgi:hypothetical protein